MRKIQVRLACLFSVGVMTLAFMDIVKAQTAPIKQNVTNVRQTERSHNYVAGIIESVNSTSINVRLADGSIKTYSRNGQVFAAIKPLKGIAIIVDEDSKVAVSRGGRPLQVFNGRIVDIKNNSLSVMLTSGQVEIIPIQPEFASQLKTLQRTTNASIRLPITGVVSDRSPLSAINYTPSSPTNSPTTQMVTRIAQGTDAKAEYSDLILACQNRKAEVGKLKALQDVANNVVRFDRIEVVDINDVLKGQNIKAFQQRHAHHTPAENLILENALNNVSVVVSNTNNVMTFEEALSMRKVNKKSIVGIKVSDDIYYGKVFVFYDSTLN
jgi:hypothetical protein